jgi:hypothetical protein
LREAAEIEENLPLYGFVLMRLTHKELAPDFVTKLLELEPTDFWINGSIDAYDRIRDYGCWSISSQSHVDSSELNDHLNWIVEQLEQKDTQLSKLKTALPGLRIFINVQWSTTAFNTVFLLNELLISRVAQSKLGLDFLVSFK